MFEKWQVGAANMVRKKYLMAEALTRQHNKQLSMAFEQWQETAIILAPVQYL